MVSSGPTNTLPKFNIAPEKRWLEDYFPFGAQPIFRGTTFFEGVSES